MAENRNDFTHYVSASIDFGKTIKGVLDSTDKLYYDNYIGALASNPYFTYTVNVGPVTMQKYIINEGATIIFWSDGSKTVSKRDKNDKFDKELGFLFAYFYKFFKGSKASRKRVIDCVEYKNIKTFLFEFYVNHSGKTAEQAKKYLQNLEVAK
jgi:hypothetical protein